MNSIVYRTRPWYWLRFASLAASLLLLLGLNHRALRMPTAWGDKEAALKLTEAPLLQVVLESSGAVSFLWAPPTVPHAPEPVHLPLPRPAWARGMATPRLRAGVGAAALCRVRLLAVALSPQAP